MTRNYWIYWMGPDWKVFDPLRDLLCWKGFLTWRELGQGTHTGAKLVGSALIVNRELTFGPESVFEQLRVKDLTKRWLSGQQLNPDTLGPWRSTYHRGILDLPVNTVEMVEARLAAYNGCILALYEDDELAYQEPMVVGGQRHFGFTPEGQVRSWNRDNIISPLHFWASIRPHMLDNIRKIQHTKFDPSSVIPITVGNA